LVQGHAGIGVQRSEDPVRSEFELGSLRQPQPSPLVDQHGPQPELVQQPDYIRRAGPSRQICLQVRSHGQGHVQSHDGSREVAAGPSRHCRCGLHCRIWCADVTRTIGQRLVIAEHRSRDPTTPLGYQQRSCCGRASLRPASTGTRGSGRADRLRDWSSAVKVLVASAHWDIGGERRNFSPERFEPRRSCAAPTSRATASTASAPGSVRPQNT
jgi:hypothetical protein